MERMLFAALEVVESDDCGARGESLYTNVFGRGVFPLNRIQPCCLGKECRDGSKSTIYHEKRR